jgi:putative tryptophan/tyrosine transport system substrate-binding protein
MALSAVLERLLLRRLLGVSGNVANGPNPSFMTPLRHARLKAFAPQKHCSFLRQSVVSSLYCMHTTSGGRGRMAIQIRRRELILGGAAAAWPLAARAQRPAMPVVGFLGAPSAAPYARYVAAVHQGLKEVNYIEHQNVAMEYRWADGQYDRLPAMASDLVSRRVAVIIPIGGAPATMAAKAATSTIPIVFNMGADPVQLGFVANLNRPGGNITGVAMMTLEIERKRLELLHELAPSSASIAVLLNPSNAQAQSQESGAQAAARVVGRKVLVLKASTEHEIVDAFATLARERAGALLIGADTFFTSQATLFVVLTARYSIPTIYPFKSYVDAGGLISYGSSLLDAYRQTGVYAGRVLKGEKPADLPILQPTKFELVINLKIAKAVGIAIPPTLLARADEVIE